jgi:glutaredoxin-related protein
MRPILSEDQIHPAARSRQESFHAQLIADVQAAVAAHDVVVVGMAQNPFPKKARKLLDARGIAYHYLEYGSYLGAWKPRLALKLWSGWPTFPMIFVKGSLIGGFRELEALLASDTPSV